MNFVFSSIFCFALHLQGVGVGAGVGAGVCVCVCGVCVYFIYLTSSYLIAANCNTWLISDSKGYGKTYTITLEQNPIEILNKK